MKSEFIDNSVLFLGKKYRFNCTYDDCVMLTDLITCDAREVCADKVIISLHSQRYKIIPGLVEPKPGSTLLCIGLEDIIHFTTEDMVVFPYILSTSFSDVKDIMSSTFTKFSHRELTDKELNVLFRIFERRLRQDKGVKCFEEYVLRFLISCVNLPKDRTDAFIRNRSTVLHIVLSDSLADFVIALSDSSYSVKMEWVKVGNEYHLNCDGMDIDTYYYRFVIGDLF